MTHRIFSAVVTAAAIAVGLAGQHFLAAEAAAQTPKAAGVPLFEVEPGWPKIPPKWKLGDASSIGIDAQDNVWVLHRPRTLPTDQAAAAAPAILVFDPAGNYIKSWGGTGSGFEWPEREHGIHIDYKGNVWLGGNNCPARALPGLNAVGGGVDIVVLDRKTLEFVDTIGGPGFLGGGHQIATDSKGNIYVAATSRGLQKLAFKGMR